jgi:hypothetical protein
MNLRSCFISSKAKIVLNDRVQGARCGGRALAPFRMEESMRIAREQT